MFGWPGALERLREKPTRLQWLVPFLLRARRELLRRGPFDGAILHFLVPCGLPLGLVEVGNGPLRCELEAFARRIGAPVRFVKRLPREARCLGTPVLSTPVGDVPHWAETDGGITLWR